MSYSNIYNDAARGAASGLAQDYNDELYSQKTAYDLNPRSSIGKLNNSGRNIAVDGGADSEQKKKEKEVAKELTQATTLNLLDQIREIDAQIAELQVRLEEIDNEIAAIEVRREEIAQERLEIAEQRQVYNQTIFETESELSSTTLAIEEIDRAMDAQEGIIAEKEENYYQEDMATGNGQALQETRFDLRTALQAGRDTANQLPSVEDAENKAIFRDAEGNIVLYDIENDQIVRPLNESDTALLEGLENRGQINIADLEDVRAAQTSLGKDKFNQEISLNEDFIALQKMGGEKKLLEDREALLTKDLANLKDQLQALDEKEKALKQEEEQLDQKLDGLNQEKLKIQQQIDALNQEKEALLKQQAELDKQFETDKDTYENRTGISYASGVDGSDSANGQTSQQFNEVAYRPSLSTIGTIQANLQELGYYERNDINQSDGLWGAQTNEAFADFLKEVQSEPGSTYQGKVDGMYGPLTRAALLDKIDKLEETDPEKAEAYQSVLKSLDSMPSGQLSNLYTRPADWNQDELEKQAQTLKAQTQTQTL